jgi:ribosomal protein S12 methylthiotransferase accessory factor
MRSNGRIFADAAALMGGRDTGLPPTNQASARLLSALGYLETTFGANPPTEHRVRLLTVADRFDRFFSLRSRAAPGLALVGAQIRAAQAPADPNDTGMVSFSGAGLTFRHAFESCAGEANEYQSQLASAADEIVDLPRTAASIEDDRQNQELIAARLGVAPDELVAAPRLTATRLSNGAQVSVPAELCLRFTQAPPARCPLVALLEGLATGRSIESAALRALLELVERDAAALWWIGGQRGRTFTPEQLARAGVMDLLREVRGSGTSRTTEFLDITSDLGIPSIAAWSIEPDGRRFACGLAARRRVEDAIGAAFVELCAMEMNFELRPSKGCGGRSNTRRSICMPTRESARHEKGSAAISISTIGADRIRVLTA